MEHQIFCDGIGRISVIGGVVRLDLFTYSPTETDANGQPRPILSHRIVMGMDGFLRSSEKVMEAVQAMTRPRPDAPQQQRPAQPPVPQPVPQPGPQAVSQSGAPQPLKAVPPQPPAPAPQPQPSAPPPVKPPFP
jgi:outer membrane biosynthesis protein TonB